MTVRAHWQLCLHTHLLRTYLGHCLKAPTRILQETAWKGASQRLRRHPRSQQIPPFAGQPLSFWVFGASWALQWSTIASACRDGKHARRRAAGGHIHTSGSRRRQSRTSLLPATGQVSRAASKRRLTSVIWPRTVPPSPLAEQLQVIRLLLDPGSFWAAWRVQSLLGSWQQRLSLVGNFGSSP